MVNPTFQLLRNKADVLQKTLFLGFRKPIDMTFFNSAEFIEYRDRFSWPITEQIRRYMCTIYSCPHPMFLTYNKDYIAINKRKYPPKVIQAMWNESLYRYLKENGWPMDVWFPPKPDEDMREGSVALVTTDSIFSLGLAPPEQQRLAQDFYSWYIQRYSLILMILNRATRNWQIPTGRDLEYDMVYTFNEETNGHPSAWLSPLFADGNNTPNLLEFYHYVAHWQTKDVLAEWGFESRWPYLLDGYYEYELDAWRDNYPAEYYLPSAYSQVGFGDIISTFSWETSYTWYELHNIFQIFDISLQYQGNGYISPI